MPDQVGLELIATALGEAIPGSVLETTFFRERAAVHVAPASVRQVLSTLKQNHGYRALMSVHGVDYYPHEPRLGVQYELLDMARVDRIAVKLRKMIQDDPDMSWRERYAAVGTEENLTGAEGSAERPGA